MTVQVSNLHKTVQNVEDDVQNGHCIERTIDNSERFLKVCLLYTVSKVLGIGMRLLDIYISM